jgi:hypothetical protein
MEHLTTFEVVLVIASAISGLYGIYQFIKLLLENE